MFILLFVLGICFIFFERNCCNSLVLSTFQKQSFVLLFASHLYLLFLFFCFDIDSSIEVCTITTICG